MNDIERLRNEVRLNGFLSSTQITVRFGNEFNNIKELIDKLECDDIKKINYINKYAGPTNVRTLFYYTTGNI